MNISMNFGILLGLCLITYSNSSTQTPPLDLNGYDNSEQSFFNFYNAHIAAFSQTPQRCIDKVLTSHDLVLNFTADCSDLIFDGDCVVWVARSRDSSNVQPNFAFFFRHPHNIKNFTTLVPTVLENMPLIEWDSTGKWGMVGSDFLTGFNRLWNAGLGNLMYEYWATDCDRLLCIIGHSAGAALAEIFAMHLRKLQLWPRSLLWLYSFGTPRVGNQMFTAKLFNSVYYPFRVYYKKDTIPRYPSTTCDRSQQAIINDTTPCYFHMGHTILYTSYSELFGATKTKCELAEDPKCIEQGNSIADHYQYFNYKEKDYDSRQC